MASGEEEELEVRIRNLRFCIAYWELALLLPTDNDEDEDVAWNRRLFREELTGFHRLVVNNVTDESLMTHTRESLHLAWKDCVGDYQDIANDNWAILAQLSKDVQVDVVNDLQLVAPGIWIGSTDTLTYLKLLDERDIQHLVYCTTSDRETRMTREQTSILPPRSHHVAKLFDLPRQQFEDTLVNVNGVEQLKTLSFSSCNEICNIASILNDLIGTCSALQKNRAPGDGGILLYCDSGISTSITMCAALLMTRYKFPLEIALSQIQAARRDILPSQHLWFQLEQLDLKLTNALPCHK